MSKTIRTVIVMSSVFGAIGLLGLLFTETDLPTWRTYIVSIVYGVGAYHSQVWGWKAIINS